MKINAQNAEELLDIQVEQSKKTKKTDVFLTVLFSAFLILFGILFFIIPDKKISDTEKRELAQAPDVSLSRIGSDILRDAKMMIMTEEQKEEYKKSEGGNYAVLSEQITDYYADQFPLRDTLRSLRTFSELFMLKKEVNGVVFTDSYLVNTDTVSGTLDGEKRTEKDAKKTIESNVQMLANAQKSVDSGIKMTVTVAGGTVDTVRAELPYLFPYEKYSGVYWGAFDGAASQYGLNAVNIKGVLAGKADKGELVYYKTDHHWTTLGAYYAYREIIEEFGITPYGLDEYEKVVFADGFLGTTYAKAGASPCGADTIELFRYEGDTDFITEIKGAENTELRGFYNAEYKNSSDKYGVFIGTANGKGGNNAVTTVTKTTDERRKKLILIKDSFGNSIVPFLARHYDLIILDMRLYNDDMAKFLSDPDLYGIIVLYNMETFMNDQSPAIAAYKIEKYFKSQNTY